MAAPPSNVAIGRSILVIIWHLLSDPQACYSDLGADFYATASIPTGGAATTSASSDAPARPGKSEPAISYSFSPDGQCKSGLGEYWPG